MRTHRLLILLAVIGLGIALWILGQRQLQARRSVLNGQAAEVLRLHDLASAEQIDVDRLRGELDAERQLALDAKARGAALAARPTERGPDAQWNEPPSNLPDWNPTSPYVWIQKSLLPEIPVQPFEGTGLLLPGLGPILALDPQRERVLNETLSRLVADARALEAASALLSSEHLSGIADQPGEKLTLQVPGQSDAARHLRSQVESALRTELGDARSELVLHWGKSWLDEQFERSAASTYSVVRHPDATYGIRIDTGSSSSMSVGGSDAFINYIPHHLRPWFEPLQNPPATSQSPQP